MEKVSVIVPVYNGEKNIKRCAGSVLNQDYPELELILIDDGSRDRSWEIIQTVAANDPRVKAIHQENGGVSSARNRALAEASGTYVQFADVDDWLPMDATKLLVREMETRSSELVVGDFYRVVDGNVSEKGSIETGGTLTLKQYADKMMLAPADLYYGVLWNKLYQRDIIERYDILMDENISYSEDMIFNLEYLLHVKSVAILKAPVYYYQYTKGSLVDQSLNLSSTIKMKKIAKGGKKTLQVIMNDFKERVADKESIVISHCQNEAFALSLRKAVEAEYPGKIVKIYPTRGLCSYYAEKGGIIVGF